jgi:hypothetical protein
VTLLRRRRAAARLALTAETATKGTAFTSNFNYDAATNRLLAQGVYSYGANGNLTAMPSITNAYDIENRLQQTVHTLNGTEQYVYNPSNQRVWKMLGTLAHFSVEMTISTSLEVRVRRCEEAARTNSHVDVGLPFKRDAEAPWLPRNPA